MKMRIAAWMFLLTLVASSGSVVHAQAPAAPEPALVPLEVQIVLSRYQGDQKVSSLPYTLMVNANGDTATTMNMASKVPVVTTAFGPASGANGQPPTVTQSYTYQNIGTNISLRANSVNEGGFTLRVTIDDSSVASLDTKQKTQNQAVSDLPVIRGFKVENTLLLKDGQSRQFTAATDRVTGDVTKVDVTLKVLK
ncbi:MAG TPA: hypothetical protein VL173_06970 [Vicinamibacterales bacterium]|jgi:type II secretory pathway component GspD/PulD (secretin)|nr:hypothetical protein [Vicinamibacterales bacterium]